ncbi:MAG: hypothetical protein SGJ09_13110, partial [Phycisphaerae bacterium]|nr:hypothetical protein [Phycisphaerae bacterium]
MRLSNHFVPHCSMGTAAMSAFALATAVALCAAPTMAGTPGTTSQRNASVRPATEPVMVKLDENGVIADDAADRLIRALDANPGKLVAIDLSGVPLDVGIDVQRVVKAQKAMANAAQKAMQAAKKARPSAAIAVSGMPVERVGGDVAKAKAVNDRFAKVIKDADAIVVRSGFIGNSNAAAGALASSNREALRLAGNKAVLFKSGDGWQTRVELPRATAAAGGEGSVGPNAGAGAGAVETSPRSDASAAAPAIANPMQQASLAPPGSSLPGEAQLVIMNWGSPSGGLGDLNGDGLVDGVDLALALALGGPGSNNGGGVPSGESAVVVLPPAGADMNSGTPSDGEASDGGAGSGDAGGGSTTTALSPLGT